MESFGSSSVFVWLRMRHWFGYSLVTVQGVWTKQMVACNAFGSQRMSCISERRSTFWCWEDEYQKCNSVSLWSASVGLGDEGLLLVTTCQVCGSVTPSQCLQMIDSSAGSEFSTGMTGVRGQREGSQGAGTHIGTWEDQQQYLSRAPHIFFFFKAREGLHIFTFFPLSLFLFGGFGPVFEKKSFWGINT